MSIRNPIHPHHHPVRAILTAQAPAKYPHSHTRQYAYDFISYTQRWRLRPMPPQPWVCPVNRADPSTKNSRLQRSPHPGWARRSPDQCHSQQPMDIGE